ncbi:MAG: dynamin family protein [Cyanobacteria bacterium J06643_4]
MTKQFPTSMTIQSELISVLRRAAGLLDASQQSTKDEVIEACDRIHNPVYRVAVFGPFNYGKSTLLNAILGEKALPIDLVPTTGAAITVKYGAEPRTRIIHTDGTLTENPGTSALQDYAVLNEQREMRTDVASVEVYCPHPLLKLGLELVDLPGTDDQQAQNDLVQQQLLSADLVIQLLDGRKLMTLAERENLRDWLLDRGINTVIFVVNFLNLMEAADRQQIAMRLRFLSESFRAQLPDGVSNLYQVDALPALRARLKGDMAAAKQTGLPALETALQIIGAQLVTGRPPAQTLPRLQVVGKATAKALRSQIQNLSVTPPSPADLKRREIQTKAQGLLKKGFEQSVDKLRRWLAPANLQAHYQLGLAQALASETTADWLVQSLQPAWQLRQQAVVEWVHQACEVLEYKRPKDLSMAFSEEQIPKVENAEFRTAPETTAEASDSNATDSNATDSDPTDSDKGLAPVAIATGLGWILGGPLGAAVLAGTTQLLNQSDRKPRQAKPDSASDSKETSKQDIDFAQQADIYLRRFSDAALVELTDYEKACDRIFNTPLSQPESMSCPVREAHLNLLEMTLNELDSQLQETLTVLKPRQ